MKQEFNIVIPMAGLGTRFEEKGYKNKKPFIDVNGKPMIQRVIENLDMEFDPKYEFIFICLQEDYEKYDFTIFDDIIGHDNWEVICLPKLTEGAAQTLLARVDCSIFNLDLKLLLSCNRSFADYLEDRLIDAVNY